MKREIVQTQIYRFHNKVAFSIRSMNRCYHIFSNSNDAYFVDSSYVESGIFLALVSSLFGERDIGQETSHNLLLVRSKNVPFYVLSSILRVTDSKYRESLDRFEKSKTLKLCLKNAFRELSSKMLFRISKN